MAAPSDGQGGEAAPVTVIGLGEMGSALATTYLERGCPTTVWNRTPERAADAVSRGAVAAADVAEATAASPLVIVSVAGMEAVHEVVDAMGEAAAGRVVVSLTDGTTAGAREAATRAEGRGARFLQGQILTVAPGIGRDEAAIFYGGAEDAFAAHEDTLRVLGGATAYLGPDVGVPLLHGMAVHGMMWGTLNSFLHGLALLGTEGTGGSRFVPHAAAVLDALRSMLPGMAEEVARADHATELRSLSRHLPSVRDLEEESRARGVDDQLPTLTRTMVEEAVARGHGGDNYSRLVDHFRSGPPQGTGATRR